MTGWEALKAMVEGKKVCCNGATAEGVYYYYEPSTKLSDRTRFRVHLHLEEDESDIDEHVQDSSIASLDDFVDSDEWEIVE